MADVKTYISAAYIPTAEDFVPVSMDSMSRASVREAASPKAEVLKRFISQKSAVAGAVFLTLLILLALIMILLMVSCHLVAEGLKKAM